MNYEDTDFRLPQEQARELIELISKSDSWQIAPYADGTLDNLVDTYKFVEEFPDYPLVLWASRASEQYAESIIVGYKDGQWTLCYDDGMYSDERDIDSLNDIISTATDIFNKILEGIDTITPYVEVIKNVITDHVKSQKTSKGYLVETDEHYLSVHSRKALSKTACESDTEYRVAKNTLNVQIYNSINDKDVVYEQNSKMVKNAEYLESHPQHAIKLLNVLLAFKNVFSLDIKGATKSVRVMGEVAGGSIDNYIDNVFLGYAPASLCLVVDGAVEAEWFEIEVSLQVDGDYYAQSSFSAAYTFVKTPMEVIEFAQRELINEIARDKAIQI